MDFSQASENDYDFSELTLGNTLSNLSIVVLIALLFFGINHLPAKNEPYQSVPTQVIVIENNDEYLAPAVVPNVNMEFYEDLMPPMLAEDSWPISTESISC